MCGVALQNFTRRHVLTSVSFRGRDTDELEAWKQLAESENTADIRFVVSCMHYNPTLCANM